MIPVPPPTERDAAGIVGSIEREDCVPYPEKAAPGISASRGMT
jgi:hypothetical protein